MKVEIIDESQIKDEVEKMINQLTVTDLKKLGMTREQFRRMALNARLNKRSHFEPSPEVIQLMKSRGDL